MTGTESHGSHFGLICRLTQLGRPFGHEKSKHSSATCPTSSCGRNLRMLAQPHRLVGLRGAGTIDAELAAVFTPSTDELGTRCHHERPGAECTGNHLQHGTTINRHRRDQHHQLDA